MTGPLRVFGSTPAGMFRNIRCGADYSTADRVQLLVNPLVAQLDELAACLSLPPHQRLPRPALLQCLDASVQQLVDGVHDSLENTAADRTLPMLLHAFLADLPAVRWSAQSLGSLPGLLARWRKLLDRLVPRLEPHTFAACSSLAEPVPPAPLPLASQDDIADLVAHIRRSGIPAPPHQQLHDLLDQRGLQLAPEDRRACVTLGWPREPPVVPGLADFLERLTDLHQRGPSPFASAARLRECVLWALSPLAPPASSYPRRAFLMRHLHFVLPYLFRQLTGMAADTATLRMLWPADTSRMLGGVRDMLRAHADLLVELVTTMAERGLPTHWREIQQALKDASRLPSRSALQSLPKAVPEIENSGVWYFPRGQQPQRLHNFEVNLRTVRLFRGAAPGAPASDDDLGPVGLCETLMSGFPQGCSTTQLRILLMEMDTRPCESACGELQRTMLRGHWLVEIAPRRVVVNPDLLCRRAAASLLERCPPRASWPAPRPLPRRVQEAREAREARAARARAVAEVPPPP